MQYICVIHLGVIGGLLDSLTGLLDGVLGIVFKRVIPILKIEYLLDHLQSGDNPSTIFELLSYRFSTPVSVIILFNVKSYPIDLTYAKPVFYRISQMNDDRVPIRNMVENMGCLKSRLHSRILKLILNGDVEEEAPTYKQMLQHINKHKRSDNTIMSNDFFALWDSTVLNVPIHITLGKTARKFGSFNLRTFKRRAMSWKKPVPMQEFLTAIEKPNHDDNMWKYLTRRLPRVPRVSSNRGSKGLLGGLLGGLGNGAANSGHAIKHNSRSHSLHKASPKLTKPTKSKSHSVKKTNSGGLLGGILG